MSLRKLIYTPSGRAGAYSNGGYAANIFKGCKHKCRYCYVPDFLKMNSEQRLEFQSRVIPAPDLLERITKDMKRVGKLPVPIFLCFTCDPYPSDPEMQTYTREVIKIINDSGNAVNILTKAGALATKDFDLLASNPNNKIGATLTFIDDTLSQEWEPEAAIPTSRVEMLAYAKEAGIKTWASIEPVIMPEQSLKIMELAIPHVDEYKIGKWNHDKTGMADAINWKQFALSAIDLMELYDKWYLLKDDLLKYL